MKYILHNLYWIIETLMKHSTAKSQQNSKLSTDFGT